MIRAKPWFALRHALRESTPTSEALEFGAVATALSWAPHVALAVSRRPYAIDDRRSAILYGIGLAGPSVAAFAVEGRHRGGEGQRELLHQADPRGLQPLRTIAALGAQPLLTWAAARLAGKRVRARAIDPAVLFGQLWVVAGEEFGWRGFLVPRLRRHFSPAKTIAITAAVWGAWHLPMFFVTGSMQQTDRPGRFASAIFAWSGLHHLLQVGRPSVATAMVFHAAANIGASALHFDDEAHRQTLVYAATGIVAIAASELLEHRAS